MKEQDFFELCKQYDYSKPLVENLEQALHSVRHLLQKEQRLSGATYYDHILEVSSILVENKADPASIIAGMIQDNLEKLPDVDKFGDEVVQIAKGVREIKNIKSKSRQLEADALRRVILATTKDVRIIIIKLAGKLANLREIKYLAKDRQKEVAQEVLEFYAPLSYRLGIERMRTELENRAFEIVNPRKFLEISNFLKQSHEERSQGVEDTITEIKKLAKGIRIIKIKGRPKHIYSIYRKMTKRKVPLNEQFDLLGVRIIVPDIEDCYTLLGRLHEHLIPIEGKLKDYIAKPKPNFYRSLHTAVKMQGKIVEIQIRTAEMDEFAEEGVAAHWRYKGLKTDSAFERQMSWLRNVLDLQKQGSKDFLETAKIDVFGDRIQCYTPKGHVKELPEEASILDFAYLVHEEVGNTCVGGKVNGKFVPLKYTLSNGDVVEIITAKNQRPRRSWLKIVKSGKTRQKIRKSLKDYETLPAFFYRKLKPAVTEDQGVLVESLEFPKAFCVLAKCCRPLPGDDIIGIATKRRVISVHRRDCRLGVKDENRWVKVNWRDTFNQKIRFYVHAKERSGLLADVLHTIVNAGFEVKEAKAKMVSKDVECSFLVVPRDLEQVKEMMQRVQKVKGIKKMFFE
jgi:GTP diphosphokinase / guanosine-3',5'-bis(diphosphate) 3'-diphosphatase